MEQAKASWNDDRLDHLETRFDSLQQAMIITLASFIVAFAGLIASLHP